MSLLKKDRFSIRKIKGIVGSVFLGSLLFAPSVVGASTYHYLDYSKLPEAVVTDKGEPEVQPALPEAVVTEKGEPEVQPALSEAVVTEKGEPAVQQDLPEAVVTEKGEPEVQQVLPEYTTKVAPTLTLDKVTEDAMDRSAKLDYTLENTGNAEIKSIIAEIKDGDTVVKRVDLSKEKF